MSRPRFRTILATGLVTIVALGAWPARAEAQRAVRRPVVSGPVHTGGYYPRYPYHRPYYPHYGYPYYPYRPWIGFGFGFGWGFPYFAPFYGPYYPPYYGSFYGGPYYPGYYGDPLSSVRLQVTPRDARVFVDGYPAGIVDDYDGTFQRLRMNPGGHEITIYRDGYRTVRQSTYFRPDSGQTVRFALEPLAAGETSEPPPQPQPQQPAATGDPADPARPPGAPPYRVEPQQAQAPQPPPARFGALTIAVQPADAEIYIDGDRWTDVPATGPGAPLRLTIRLTEGRHRLEIKKAGFVTYSETIGIGRDRTLTLNISLARNE